VLLTKFTLKSRDDQVSASVNMESRKVYKEIIYYGFLPTRELWAGVASIVPCRHRAGYGLAGEVESLLATPVHS
jgi:hypothetical protein